MAELICEVAESRIQPVKSAPLVSLFVPTYNRVPEMVQAVESLAAQLHGGLEDKVEILISDNASGSDGREAIRALADRFGTVSYMVNAIDQGGHAQVFMAPWRVRGVYTWVFGSDDVLEAGGVASVVERLEADAPDFLTMDKQIWDRALTRQLYATANGLPGRTFPSFIELFKGVGMRQVAYLGASVEKTEAGKRIDPVKWAAADTYHSYMIAYFEKHQHGKCIYMPEAPVLRRLDNSGIHDNMGGVLTDVGMQMPVVLSNMAKPYGFTDDVFDQVPGSRFIDSYDPPTITLVDNLYEDMLRAIGAGRFLSYFQRAAFEQMSLSWRPHRRKQFDDIWQRSERMRATTEAMNELRARYDRIVIDSVAEREELRRLALTFSDKKPA